MADKQFIIREYPRSEYLADLEKEVRESGLRKTIQDRLDEIEGIARHYKMSYVDYHDLTYMLCEIDDLMQMQEAKDGHNGDHQTAAVPGGR